MKATAMKSKFFALTLTATVFVFLTKLSIFTASPVQSSTGSATDNIIRVTFDPKGAKEGDEESTQREGVGGYTGTRQSPILRNRNATRKSEKPRRFPTAAKKNKEVGEEKKKKKGAIDKKKSQEERKARRKLSALTLSSGAALRNIDFSTYSPEDRAILESRAGVLAERARAVARVCQATPASKGALEAGNFIWDLKHTPGIVWCPIYKVASTTWLRNFLRLAHFNEDNPKIPEDLPEERREKRRFLPRYGATHNTAFEMYHSPAALEERDQALKSSARVIIVRHPFTRLLSAYRDKITKANPHPKKFKFKELQVYIVAKYRKSHSADASPTPTFPEFVQHVIDSTENLSSAAEWKENVKCWTPYWIHCNVCHLDYNVIMKLESIEQDEQFLITLSHLEELKNRTSWVHLNGASSSQLAMQYYKELTRHQMLQLYKRYELDFKLFQYDIDDYLAIAKDA